MRSSISSMTSIAHDYALAADDNQVAMLLDACSKGHAMNFSIPKYLEDVTQLPGVIRLTLLPTMTNLEFEYVTDQWQGYCLCNFICKQDLSKEKISQLDELIKQNDLHHSGSTQVAPLRLKYDRIST
jgi:hypothetical protein